MHVSMHVRNEIRGTVETSSLVNQARFFLLDPRNTPKSALAAPHAAPPLASRHPLATPPTNNPARSLRRAGDGGVGARAEPAGAGVEAAVRLAALPPHHAPARALRLLLRPRPPVPPPPPALLRLPCEAGALRVPARVRRAQARAARHARALLQPRRLRRSPPSSWTS